MLEGSSELGGGSPFAIGITKGGGGGGGGGDSFSLSRWLRMGRT